MAALEHISKIFLMAHDKLLDFSCYFFKLEAVDSSFLSIASLSFVAFSQSFEILILMSSFSLLFTYNLALLFLIISSLRSLSIFSFLLASLRSVISLLSDLISTSSFFLLSLPWINVSSLITSSFFATCLVSCLFFSLYYSRLCSNYSFSTSIFLNSSLDYLRSSSLLPIYLVFLCNLSIQLFRDSMSLYNWIIRSSFAFIWFLSPTFRSFLVLAQDCASFRSAYNFLFFAFTFLLSYSSRYTLSYNCLTFLAESSLVFYCFTLFFISSTFNFSLSSSSFKAFFISSSFLRSQAISMSLSSKISFQFLRRYSNILALVLYIPHSMRLTDSSIVVFCFFFIYLPYLSFSSLIYSFSCFTCAVLLEKVTISSMYRYIVSILLDFSFFGFLLSSASSCDN